MKKRLFLFDDIFYVSYMFFRKNPKHTVKSAANNAIIVLESTILIPLCCIVGVYSGRTNMPSIRDTFDLRMIVILVVGAFAIGMYNYYESNKDVTEDEYGKFKRRWEKMSDKQKGIRKRIITGIIIFNTIGIFALTILLEHFNII